MIAQLSDFVITLLSLPPGLFIFAVGLPVLVVVVLFMQDVSPTRHAIRRNYPLIGRFRYYVEHLGTFFRQYVFAMDREEMPFNREQRCYIYRAAKDLDTTRAFGSTRDLRPAGSVSFVNCPFPSLESDAAVEPARAREG
ncbi:MAG: hypothetical protein QNJ30_08745 [Kiloniellales bacterium]|nr:hypothetical protein [Kiloniellales bacterium]